MLPLDDLVRDPFLSHPVAQHDDPDAPGSGSDDEGSGSDDGAIRHDGDVKEDLREKLKEPDMWDVILHNDDYTTKGFVVEVLRRVFRKNAAEATAIMMKVHRHGRGVVGTYTYDIAHSKASKVHQLAKQHEYPLRCSVKRSS